VGFGPEHNYDLWHFRGALAMAQTNAGNSIGSQFYIVHRNSVGAAFENDLKFVLEHLDEVIWPEDWDGVSPHLTLGDRFPKEMLEHYLAVGGTPDLDFPFNTRGPNFGHTVFGHVVEGMDVVDSIATTPVHPRGHNTEDRPLRDVIIERVSILVYQG
jgi:peptidyl-prolyl cis-trans isomerase B (cyclophilin B)